MQWQAPCDAPCDVCAVASTIGAALVFPGPSALKLGALSNSPPFLPSLAAVFFVWAAAPTLTMSLTALFFVLFRNWFFRGEDSFHRVLWVSMLLIA